MTKTRNQINKGNLWVSPTLYPILLYVHLHICGVVHMQRVRGQVFFVIILHFLRQGLFFEPETNLFG